MPTYNAYPVEQAVISEIITKLSDDTYGLNATYNGIAAVYGVPANLAIDFVGGTKGKSANFAQVNVDPDEWEETGAFDYPMVTLFTGSGANVNHQKFQLYSGPVDVGMNVFLSWREQRFKLAVFEPMAYCMADAVTQVFNRARNAFPGDQDWDAGGNDVAYNGNISWQKSRITSGGLFWRQVIAFKFLFEVNQRGDV